MADAAGHVMVADYTPAVSVGLWAGGRFPARDLAPYIGVLVAGALLASAILHFIAIGRPAVDLGGFAANVFGEHSPWPHTLAAGLATDISLTFGLLVLFLGWPTCPPHSRFSHFAFS